MTKYREILRLQSLGFSERNIAQSCGVSRNTVAKVLKKAAEINISWPLDFDMTDSALEELMFPKDKSVTNKRMPDFDYIRKELLRNGVNKKLLWVEYCEECRMSNEEPLMYSQFCYYIQKDEEKRRATMHIPRKPGEQIEVDWAGDPAHIFDPDTGDIRMGTVLPCHCPWHLRWSGIFPCSPVWPSASAPWGFWRQDFWSLVLL